MLGIPLLEILYTKCMCFDCEKLLISHHTFPFLATPHDPKPVGPEFPVGLATRVDTRCM